MFEVALCRKKKKKDKRASDPGTSGLKSQFEISLLVQQGFLTSVSLSFLFCIKEVQCLSRMIFNENLLIYKMSNLAQCFTYNKPLTHILVSLTSKITHFYISLFLNIQIATFKKVFCRMLECYPHFQVIYHIPSLCRQMQAQENVSWEEIHPQSLRKTNDQHKQVMLLQGFIYSLVLTPFSET